MAEEIVGIIGGSGLGDALHEFIKNPVEQEVDTPFGSPSGAVLTGHIGANRIAFINRHGDGHVLSPSQVPYAANIFALKKLGVHSLIASCAVGSLREEYAPTDLVVVDQFIDKTFRRRSSFFDDLAAVHCEMAQPTCSRLRNKIVEAAKEADIKTHKGGTYVCMEGPQFSTRAESLMHRSWGGDMIGMTAMPEAKLAREAQMCYALIAIVSDYDCWREHEANKDKQTLLKEIISNLTAGTSNAIKVIEAVLGKDGDLCADDCHCRKSLELAMWTAQERVSKRDKQKLSVLFE